MKASLENPNLSKNQTHGEIKVQPNSLKKVKSKYMQPKSVNKRRMYSVNYFGSRIQDKIEKFTREHKLNFDLLGSEREQEVS